MRGAANTSRNLCGGVDNSSRNLCGVATKVLGACVGADNSSRNLCEHRTLILNVAHYYPLMVDHVLFIATKQRGSGERGYGDHGGEGLIGKRSHGSSLKAV